MATAVREIPTYNPFTAYEVFSFNEDYNGDVGGVRFISGKALFEALPKGAGEDEIEERTQQLMWFWNSAEAIRYVPDAQGRPERKTFPGYTIKPKGR